MIDQFQSLVAWAVLIHNNKDPGIPIEGTWKTSMTNSRVSFHLYWSLPLLTIDTSSQRQSSRVVTSKTPRCPFFQWSDRCTQAVEHMLMTVLCLPQDNDAWKCLVHYFGTEQLDIYRVMEMQFVHWYKGIHLQAFCKGQDTSYTKRSSNLNH